jgi:hypothetical protein
MKHNIFSSFGGLVLVLLTAFGFAACSSSDDDYEPATALSANN